MTITTALASAVAGDIVGLLPGWGDAYQATATDSRITPAHTPANAGTLGNLITFVAKYPAANLNDPLNNSNRTELSHDRSVFTTPGPPADASEGGPVFGCVTDYVRWIGIAVDGSLSLSHSDTGMCNVWAADGGEIHQCYLRGYYTQYVDNYNAIRIEAADDAVIWNNHLSNIHRGYGNPSHNCAAIMTYGSRGFDIQHNHVYDCDAGIFVKGSANSGTTWNSGLIQYNKVELMVNTAILVDQIEDDPLYIDVVQNLMIECPISLEFDNSAIAKTQNRRFRYNTVVEVSSGDTWASWIREVTGSGDNRLQRNILCSRDNSSDSQCVNGGDFTGTNSDYVIEDNHYYRAGSALLFSWNGSNYTDADDATAIAAFNAASGATGGTSGDPDFVNAAGGDYRLNLGSPATGCGCYLTGDEEIGIEAVPALS